MSPLDLDIEVPRNGHYAQNWQFLDDAGSPIDLTGYSVEMSARAAAGSGSILASADITLDDPANGVIGVLWSGKDFDGVAGTMEIVRLAYDLRLIAPDSIVQVLARGHIILFPEVTPWP